MTKLSTKLKEEFFTLLPPTIFFFVALHIVAFVRVLMLKGTGVSPLTSISVAVAALILGKAVLIADMLPMINRYPNHSARVDCYVLHDARTGARDWQGKGAADILRPDTYPAGLSEALMAEAKKNRWLLLAKLIAQ